MGGRLAFTLLREIGVGFKDQEVNIALIRESITELAELHKS